MASRLIIVAVIIVLKVLTPTWFREYSTDFLMLVETGLALIAYALFRWDRTLLTWSNILIWNALLYYLGTVVVDDYYYKSVFSRLALILHLHLQIPKSVGYAVEFIHFTQVILSLILSLALIVRAIESANILLRREKGD
jgi:hypothetical protein